jgi:hypothetical protein
MAYMKPRSMELSRVTCTPSRRGRGGGQRTKEMGRERGLGDESTRLSPAASTTRSPRGSWMPLTLTTVAPWPVVVAVCGATLPGRATLSTCSSTVIMCCTTPTLPQCVCVAQGVQRYKKVRIVTLTTTIRHLCIAASPHGSVRVAPGGPRGSLY